jgi:RNA polymerase sigma-70 factor (ECF subfamily)
MTEAEENLITAAVAGDRNSFGELYDLYNPKIYRFILFKVGSVAEAQDLTHQVFLNAWTNIYTYRDLGYPFGSWLYRIAKNQIIDHYRTARHHTSLDEHPEETIAGLPHSDDGAAYEESFELTRVMKAIEKLKPEYQDIVIMRFVEDMSIKEIADVIEKSEGAVKLLQHRAIAQLKTLLEQ